MAETVRTTIDERGVGSITLARPEKRNAFDEAMIDAIAEAVAAMGSDDIVRAVLLCGEGKSFSAGADLGMMRRLADYSESENIAEGRRLSEMLYALATCPKPTVALVRGAAIGGGLGLVAACDIVVAEPDAVFAFSEVRLGLIPATIAPFVLKAIGPRAAGRYFLTAERFNAPAAERMGLVHQVADDLEAAGERFVADLLSGSTFAHEESKRLIADMAGQPITPALLLDTAERLAAVRAGEDCRRATQHFLETKRPPDWSRS